MPDLADATTFVTTLSPPDRPALHVFAVSGGLASTNAFLIACDETRQAVVFDAPDHTMQPIVDDAVALQLDVVGLWLTHGHFDHVADHKVVTDAFPKAKVLIHELDAPKLREPGSKVFPLPFTIPPREPDAFVTDGETLMFGRLSCDVLFTPGHAPG
ncbi:MAG: MBL fold metallo-hydrolase, partial [Planctomycetota bacterium]